jgi:hypothetical protein
LSNSKEAGCCATPAKLNRVELSRLLIEFVPAMQHMLFEAPIWSDSILQIDTEQFALR